MTVPTIGQEPWGEALNAHLADLEQRVGTLEDRIVTLEAQKEHVFNSYAWQFSSSAPPATGNQLRLNNPAPSAASAIDFRKIDADGADRTPIFQQLDVDSTIRITDWNDASHIYRYAVTGPATFGVDNVTVPVAWVSGSGVVPNAKVNVGFLVAIEV